MSALQVVNQSTDVIEAVMHSNDIDLAKRIADRMAEMSRCGERFAVIELNVVYVTPEREPM